MDANTWEATELKMTVGSEMETAGVMGKLKETAGSEAGMVAGMESGADTAAGMDLESTVDRSGAVAGAEASMRCVIAIGGGDVGADLQLVVAGTATEVDAMVVAKLRVGPIAEIIPLACTAVNAWLRIAGVETKQVG